MRQEPTAEYLELLQQNVLGPVEQVTAGMLYIADDLPTSPLRQLVREKWSARLRQWAKELRIQGDRLRQLPNLPLAPKESLDRTLERLRAAPPLPTPPEDPITDPVGYSESIVLEALRWVVANAPEHERDVKQRVPSIKLHVAADAIADLVLKHLDEAPPTFPRELAESLDAWRIALRRVIDYLRSERRLRDALQDSIA